MISRGTTGMYGLGAKPKPDQTLVAAAVLRAFAHATIGAKWRGFTAVVSTFPRTLKATCGQVLHELDTLTAVGFLEYSGAGQWRRS